MNGCQLSNLWFAFQYTLGGSSVYWKRSNIFDNMRTIQYHYYLLLSAGAVLDVGEGCILNFNFGCISSAIRIELNENSLVRFVT